jgi:hypothetical protein
MKAHELEDSRIIKSALLENWMSDDLLKIIKDGGILFEMANLKSKITDLPANIILWTRAQPDELPHTKYRLKITKDHKHPVTYSVAKEPEVLERYNVGKKYSLDSYEESQIIKFIKQFYPLIISYVDAKISADDLEYQIQKINNEN